MTWWHWANKPGCDSRVSFPSDCLAAWVWICVICLFYVMYDSHIYTQAWIQSLNAHKATDQFMPVAKPGKLSLFSDFTFVASLHHIIIPCNINLLQRFSKMSSLGHLMLNVQLNSALIFIAMFIIAGNANSIWHLYWFTSSDQKENLNLG